MDLGEQCLQEYQNAKYNAGMALAYKRGDSGMAAWLQHTEVHSVKPEPIDYQYQLQHNLPEYNQPRYNPPDSQYQPEYGYKPGSQPMKVCVHGHGPLSSAVRIPSDVSIKQLDHDNTAHPDCHPIFFPVTR